ncbi:MAG: hypothetical protein KF855_07165 [Acidobacteria bacterium]|nr:hypothetical protein [Acidobacteriota bacterium]
MKKPLLSFLLIAFLIVPLFGQKTEKESVLDKCAELFGKASDDESHLFEVGEFYVLQVILNADNNLKRLSVKSKEYYSDIRPEWEDMKGFDYLSLTEYQYLLTKLDLIKSKGKLVKGPPSVMIVTNSTAWSKEEYEHAIIDIGYRQSLLDDEDAPRRVRMFYIDYEKDNGS